MRFGGSARVPGAVIVLSVVMLVITGLLGGPANAAPVAALTAPQQVGFQPLTPGRLIDTRLTGGPVGAGATLKVPVLGRQGVPAGGVGSVALNITVTGGTKSTYVTAWPSGTPKPGTSTVNATAGAVVANSVVVGVGGDGSISVFNNSGSIHVVVDVTGWFPSASGVTPIAPKRVLDTRTGSAIGAGATRTATVAGGASSVPLSAIAVTATITVTKPTRSGYVTVYPYGTARPGTSTVNFSAGATVANSMFATVGSGGQVSIYNHTGSSHVIVDITGYLTASSGYVALPVPQRVADTRDTTYWASGYYGTSGRVGASGFTAGVQYPKNTISPKPVMPYGSGAAVVNITATQPSANGFVTAWPFETPKPGTSTLNFRSGQTVANGAILGTPDGLINLATNSGASAYLLVDVTGYFPGDGVGLLNVSSTFRDNSIGTDKIGVVWCEEAGYPLNRATIIANLNGTVKSYFTWASRDRYNVTFYDSGKTVPITTASSGTACYDQLDNVITPGQGYNGALGIIGTARSTDPNNSFGLAGPGVPVGGTSFPGNGRAGQVSANSVFSFGSNGPAYFTVSHELGHMVDAPHSFTTDSPTEYTNTMDLMSRAPASVSGSALARTKVIAPMGVDRLRAGWIDPSQVKVHPGGSVTYTVQPIAGNGVQLVAIPSGIPGKFTTIEVRRKVSNDQWLDKDGVEINKVQESTALFRHGLSSRNSPAVGTAGQLVHVLGAGQNLTLGAVTVTVGAKNADGSFPVTVSGSKWNFPSMISGQALESSTDSDAVITVPTDPFAGSSLG